MMTAPILLDTCAAMFLVADEPMADAAKGAIEASAVAGVPLRLSPITAWEVGLMVSKGRFRSSLTPQRWFEALCALPGIALCELTPTILMQSWSLPSGLRHDPADRIMAATAREFGFTVMTRDPVLLDYARAGHMLAIPC